MLPLTYRSPSTCSFSARIASAVVGADDLRVAPRRVGQRARDDVLGALVEERRAGIVLDGARRPRRLEHLVGDAPEQDPSGALGHGADGLAHLGVEAVLEPPGRRVDHAVKGHELVDVDGSHGSSSKSVSRLGRGSLGEIIGAIVDQRGSTRTVNRIGVALRARLRLAERSDARALAGARIAVAAQAPPQAAVGVEGDVAQAVAAQPADRAVQRGQRVTVTVTAAAGTRTTRTRPPALIA